MIVERTSSGSAFKKLFSDFFLAARETVRSGRTPAFSPEDYGSLREFAEDERKALAELSGETVSERELTAMFIGLWALETQFINCCSSTKAGFRTDGYWEMLVGAVDAFVKKHRFTFAKSLAVCFLDEVERRDKKERTGETAA